MVGAELPERERTKHVHRLHPYLGKFVPQLVEALLARYVRPRGTRARSVRGVRDDARAGARVGVRRGGRRRRVFQLPADAGQDRPLRPFLPREELRDADSRRGRSSGARRAATSPSGTHRGGRRAPPLPRAARRLRARDVLRVVLARAARSARLTTHFDLEFPRAPQLEPYWCHKHRRTCRPVEEADKFLGRYLLDTLDRLKAFQRVRAASARRRGPARRRPATSTLEGRFDAILTSPPYPGLIDYHEQHRYAYELLGLDDRRERRAGRRRARHEPRRGRGVRLRNRRRCCAAARKPLAPGRTP